MISCNKIKILSPQQAMQIAAGEVIERPAHIIKEILENSIDAQATKITITVCQAGKSLIKVTDNGCGMTPDDAKLSVASHATSKISCVQDLDTISSFGFRGEALASINAVSNVTITTKTADAHTGTAIFFHHGRFIKESIESHPTGTTIEISDLFENIPARKKFLKKDETEWRAITILFQAFCLDYPTIHFQLFNEDKLVLNCPATDNLSVKATQIFDYQLQQKTTALIEQENPVCKVSGLISTASYYRYDRNQIFIFVNHRWIKNIDLTKAIMKGYSGLLPAQKFPASIIFIDIASDQIDVNIHPKKEEVKFLHPKKVESIIISSIKATLDASAYQQPELQKNQLSRPAPFSFLQQQTPNTNVSIINHNKIPSNPAVSNKEVASSSIFNHDEFESLPKITIPKSAAHAFEPPQRILEKQSEVIADFEQEMTIIGQYTSTYIVCEKNKNLIFVDQHAAHERILYEQFKANFTQIPTIQLLFPEFIKLQATDLAIIAPNLSILKDHGIIAEVFSPTQLLIQAVPVHLKNQALSEIILQIIGWISEFDSTDFNRMTYLLHEKIHAKMACSSAIKAGDTLSPSSMKQLLTDLQKTESRFSCPHGRPTFWELPIDYLEKQFKRDYAKKADLFSDFL